MGRSGDFVNVLRVFAGLLTGFVLLTLAAPATAQRALNPSAVELSNPGGEVDLSPEVVNGITRLVRSHPSLIGLKVEVRIGKIRQEVVPCPITPEYSLATKGRPWGNFNVTVRCAKPFWAISVPVQTRVFGPEVVATRYLAQGSRLKADDLEVITHDITRSPTDLVRDPAEVIGKVISRAVLQGAPLVLNNLREPAVIRVGEGVRIQVQGKGFSASGEGVALSAGAIGDSIAVRMPDGQKLQGRVVRAGLVEVLVE